MGNSGIEYLSLHIVQCWRSCVVDEEKRDVHMIMYCSCMVYRYYSRIGFLPIKQNGEGKDIHN